MKATGIVRRVDDLGRIVIPKEIRRTLRIKDGDPLEIFIENGAVLYKKYSAIKNIEDFAQSYTDSLYKTTGFISIITDRDMVVAISGIAKRDFISKSISEELERIIDSREMFNSSIEHVNIINDQSVVFNSIVINPILSEGEIIGSVIITSIDKNINVSNIEIKLVQQASNFLGKQMEE